MAGVTNDTSHGVVDINVLAADHEWLVGVLRDPSNRAPQFRMPDLLGACIGLVLGLDNPEDSVFGRLLTDVVLRSNGFPRRHSQLWLSDFALLQEMQRSEHNKFPNPNFSLDEILSACVAIARDQSPSHTNLFDRARVNTANRQRGGRFGVAR